MSSRRQQCLTDFRDSIKLAVDLLMGIGYQRCNLILPRKTSDISDAAWRGIEKVAVNNGHSVVNGQVRMVALHCFLYKKLEFVAKIVKNHTLSACCQIAVDWPGMVLANTRQLLRNSGSLALARKKLTGWQHRCKEEFQSCALLLHGNIH
jgi:hypothetical protein